MINHSFLFHSYAKLEEQRKMKRAENEGSHLLIQSQRAWLDPGWTEEDHSTHHIFIVSLLPISV